MPVPQSLRYGAFDAKKKRDIQDEERARANPWPNPTPDVAPGSRKVSEPIFTGLGGSRASSENSGVTNTISGVMDESPVTEMEALKSRFGYGSAGIDEERNAQARQNFLSHPTTAQQMFNGRYKNTDQTFTPEQTDRLLNSMKAHTGSYVEELAPLSNEPFEIKYLPLQPGQEGKLTRDFTFKSGRNRARIQDEQDFQDLQLRQGEMARARQEADIQNALRQEAAHQKMAIEAEDAKRMQEFFATTGAVPSPQAAQEYLRQVGRQRASSQFMEAIKGLIARKENEYKRLFKGYENTPEAELPAAIRMQAAALDRKYSDIENKMAMAAGMQAGTNNPGNMADKENNPPIY